MGTHTLHRAKDVLKNISGDVVFIGDGLNVYKDEILQEEGQRLRSKKRKSTFSFQEKKDLWFPKAKNLALLASALMKEKKFDKAQNILPLYLYPDDCQVRR